VGEGKYCLVKDNVARNDDTVGGEVEAPVALMIRSITKKGTECEAGGKLVRSGGGEVGVAGAPETAKIVIGRMGAMEGEEGGAHV